jgi:hypothetical protein
VVPPLAVALALAALFADESLARTAQKERDRRRAQGTKTQRVFTNDDLVSGERGPGTFSVTGASPAPSPAPAASPAPGGSSRAELEQRWRERFALARQRIREAEARCWVTVIEPVLVGGGGIGGFGAGTAIYVPMQVRKFAESEELRQATRALGDLEEELRRSGGLPGWGRED